jgi:hypothetical protein
LVLARNACALEFEAFPQHLDRIYGDLALLTERRAVLLELKRNRAALTNEYERKRLRSTLIQSAGRDHHLRHIGLKCHWLSFWEDRDHRQLQYLHGVGRLTRFDEALGGNPAGVAHVPELGFDYFVDRLFAAETVDHDQPLPVDLDGDIDVGVEHAEFASYLKVMADIAGGEGNHTAALYIDASRSPVQFQVVEGFNGLIEIMRGRVPGLDKKSRQYQS